MDLIASLRWSLDQRPALSDGARKTRPRNGRRAWLAVDIYHRRVDGRLGIKYRAVDRTMMILLKNNAAVALSVRHQNVSASHSIETTVLHEATPAWSEYEYAVIQAPSYFSGVLVAFLFGSPSHGEGKLFCMCFP